ncbi:uncharacterized protein B0H18DRAFT_1120921 [Fomitopsis serialis]|uniref:uncharacterized protein n=1 Tax=Fomitopsis serialis TaxID=139415 RepID=UPI0020081302|nr:uncharacterized protein B0H18DRAFT_1120921 [Neoantrodia serialis]KAH9922360.1 hypothetical protein B0H18DRAFT_1120921 [Neoantrodia serialis]
MSQADAAPACRNCVIHPPDNINQHTWLVNETLKAWKDAGPKQSFKQMATDVATAFEAQFDINVRGLVLKKGRLRLENDEEYTKRATGRLKSIKKWIENNKPWFDKRKSGPLDLLPIPLPQPVKPQAARQNAKSARGLFIHDYPHFGTQAKAEARQAGLSFGEQTTTSNLAITRAIERMKAEEPDKWAHYEVLAAQSKAEADAANAAMDAAAQLESDADDSDDDDLSKVETLDQRQARLRYTARVAVDKWSEETETEIFMYIGWMDSGGRPRRTLVSAGIAGTDRLVNHLKSVENGVHVNALDEYVLETRRPTMDPATTDLATAQPAASGSTVPPLIEPSEAPADDVPHSQALASVQDHASGVEAVPAIAAPEANISEASELDAVPASVAPEVANSTASTPADASELDAVPAIAAADVAHSNDVNHVGAERDVQAPARLPDEVANVQPASVAPATEPDPSNEVHRISAELAQEESIPDAIREPSHPDGVRQGGHEANAEDRTRQSTLNMDNPSIAPQSPQHSSLVNAQGHMPETAVETSRSERNAADAATNGEGAEESSGVNEGSREPAQDTQAGAGDAHEEPDVGDGDALSSINARKKTSGRNSSRKKPGRARKSAAPEGATTAGTKRKTRDTEEPPLPEPSTTGSSRSKRARTVTNYADLNRKAPPLMSSPLRRNEGASSRIGRMNTLFSPGTPSKTKDTNDPVLAPFKEFVRQLCRDEDTLECDHHPAKQLQYLTDDENCAQCGTPNRPKFRYLSGRLGPGEHKLIKRMRDVLTRLKEVDKALDRARNRPDRIGEEKHAGKENLTGQKAALDGERTQLEEESRLFRQQRDGPSQAASPTYNAPLRQLPNSVAASSSRTPNNVAASSSRTPNGALGTAARAKPYDSDKSDDSQQYWNELGHRLPSLLSSIPPERDPPSGHELPSSSPAPSSSPLRQSSLAPRRLAHYSRAARGNFPVRGARGTPRGHRNPPEVIDLTLDGKDVDARGTKRRRAQLDDSDVIDLTEDAPEHPGAPSQVSQSARSAAASSWSRAATGGPSASNASPRVDKPVILTARDHTARGIKRRRIHLDDSDVIDLTEDATEDRGAPSKVSQSARSAAVSSSSGVATGVPSASSASSQVDKSIGTSSKHDASEAPESSDVSRENSPESQGQEEFIHVWGYTEDGVLPSDEYFNKYSRDSFTCIFTEWGLELTDAIAVWLSPRQRWWFTHVESLVNVPFCLRGGDYVVWVKWGVRDLLGVDTISNEDIVDGPLEWPDLESVWDKRHSLIHKYNIGRRAWEEERRRQGK